MALEIHTQYFLMSTHDPRQTVSQIDLMLQVICQLAHLKTKAKLIEIALKSKRGSTQRLTCRKQHRTRRGYRTPEVVQSQKTISSAQTVIKSELIDCM